MLQMDLGLGALFLDEAATGTATAPARSSWALPDPHDSTIAQIAADYREKGASDVPQERGMGGPVIDSGLPFGMQIDTYAEGTIKSLLEERDSMKEDVARYQKAYDDLEQRICRKAAVDIDLPAEVVRRLNRLENDIERYRTENTNLRDSLSAAHSEIIELQDEIAGQKNKLKGAGKKVRNAKDVAGKQEEKAKSAVNDKQLRIASERRMKQARNEAIAEVAHLTKMCDFLQTNLEVERAGNPHLRVDDPGSDLAVAVIPVELSIQRAHFQHLFAVFESNQIRITEHLLQWYTDWKKPMLPSRQVVGASYVDRNRDNGDVNLDKLYADMVDLVDGHVQTGAEHDNRRSTRSLQTICRNAEERHNNGN